MKFNPKSEKEISEANLWAEGIYEFEIVDAEETTSKNGNAMIKMRVRLHHPDGMTMMVDDYLVDTQKAAFKIRHCAEAVGLLADYESGSLDARDLLNRAGRCKVRIQKDTSGTYPDKNSIGDYVKASGAVSAPVARSKPADIDDEIPF
jgi:hypothetical protein